MSVRAIGIAICALGLAACGSAETSGPNALSVHVDFSHSAQESAHVTCSDVRSCTPGAVRGAELRRLLTEKPPADQACTMVYGGPQTAVARGTVGGRDVDVRFSREDGCAIERYRRLLAALGLPERRP